jgi:hypothetical protein
MFMRPDRLHYHSKGSEFLRQWRASEIRDTWQIANHLPFAEVALVDLAQFKLQQQVLELDLKDLALDCHSPQGGNESDSPLHQPPYYSTPLLSLARAMFLFSH